MNETMQLSLLRERFYRRERRSVPAAREFVRGAVADWGFGARLDDVLLCVSELATNALVHGAPPGRGYLVRLLLEEVGAALRVEVHDSGGGQPGVREPDGDSGRGLLLVAAVADRWGVGERNPGKIVWCAFGRPGAFGGDLVAGRARLGEG
ncbi:ATP-binding protein [Streptomyces sp. NBC_01240]|uniref:ATP-binding protein n=1 Tax=Streptomyces sp. NBC_01240 TaxID=2903793 RepID=UPI002E165D04|nr:ATP-binding protein [Streptomyces sp. NBC_01240]